MPLYYGEILFLGGEEKKLEYIQEITLDVNSNVAYSVVSAKQGDIDSRKLLVHFTKDGNEYPINENNSVALRLKKPDGHIVFNNCQVKDDGSVLVTFTY